jgi:hypothetical protein
MKDTCAVCHCLVQHSTKQLRSTSTQLLRHLLLSDYCPSHREQCYLISYNVTFGYQFPQYNANDCALSCNLSHSKYSSCPSRRTCLHAPLQGPLRMVVGSNKEVVFGYSRLNDFTLLFHISWKDRLPCRWFSRLNQVNVQKSTLFGAGLKCVLSEQNLLRSTKNSNEQFKSLSPAINISLK